MKGPLSKIGVMLLGAIIFAGMFTSCGQVTDGTTTTTTTTTPPTTTSTTPTPTPFTITDYKGREITITNNHPQKIVSLAPSNTEILFALGLGDRVAGVSDFCNYPPEATTKPSVGAYDNPNIEVIVAMEADLILATDAQSDSTYEQLESRGLTVVAIIPHNMNEVLESITLIGKITGTEAEAASLVANMQQRIDAVTEKTSKLTEEQKPRVFYIFWHDPIWTAGDGTFEDTLIEMAGGINIAHELSGWTTISLEAIIDANPQVFIAGVGMGEGEDLPLQYLQTEERLRVTEAYLNNRIYGINTDIIGRPGPRLVDALEELFRLIHPELQ